MGSVSERPPYVAAQLDLALDERLTSLCQPDTIVSAQYFETLRRKALLEPEKRLMLAILEDAVNCFQDNLLAQGGRAQRLFEEAEEWILEEDGDWLFSFANICEVLGLNRRYVRQGLLRWKGRKQLKHRKAWQERKMFESVVPGK